MLPGMCTRCDQLERIVAQQAARIEHLEELLGLNSKNSSKPPSSDQKSNRPPPRKGGALPGHRVCLRSKFAEDQIDQRSTCTLDACPVCGGKLSLLDETPGLHQQIEWTEHGVRKFEYVLSRYYCCACKKRVVAPLPKGVGRSAFGPQLEAKVLYLGGVLQLSKRSIVDAMQELGGVHISLGTISHMEAMAQRSLEGPCEEVHQTLLSTTTTKYADETTWRCSGRRCYLWFLGDDKLSYFHMDESRSQKACQRLLGEKVVYPLVTDRYSAYRYVSGPHQYCLAHVSRDFERIAERAGNDGWLGQALLTELQGAFRAEREYRQGRLSRRRFLGRSTYRKSKVEGLLLMSLDLGSQKLKRFSWKLLQELDCLWTYLRVPGMSPTNNLAERALRPAVLWRKRSQGTKSARGQRFVAQMCTVVGSLRRQGRRVLDFLEGVLGGKRTGRQMPSLLG